MNENIDFAGKSKEFQDLADAYLINRYLKVPRVILTSGVGLVSANLFGLDNSADEGGDKKILMTVFALSFTEMKL